MHGSEFSLSVARDFIRGSDWQNEGLEFPERDAQIILDIAQIQDERGARMRQILKTIWSAYLLEAYRDIVVPEPQTDELVVDSVCLTLGQLRVVLAGTIVFDERCLDTANTAKYVLGEDAEGIGFFHGDPTHLRPHAGIFYQTASRDPLYIPDAPGQDVPGKILVEENWLQGGNVVLSDQSRKKSCASQWFPLGGSRFAYLSLPKYHQGRIAQGRIAVGEGPENAALAIVRWTHCNIEDNLDSVCRRHGVVVRK